VKTSSWTVYQTVLPSKATKNQSVGLRNTFGPMLTKPKCLTALIFCPKQNFQVM